MKSQTQASSTPPPGSPPAQAEPSNLIVLFHSLLPESLSRAGTFFTSGSVELVEDSELKSKALEIIGNASSTNYLFFPESPSATIRSDPSLGFLLLTIKPIARYCSFEFTIEDSKNVLRKFKASNFGSAARLKPQSAIVPMKLQDGWNRVSVNLNDICRKAYGTDLKKLVRFQLNGGIRVRRVLLAEEDFGDQVLAKGVEFWKERQFEEEGGRKG